MKKLTVMLDDELYTAVKVEAARKGEKLKDFVASALAEWLEVQEDLDLGALAREAREEAEREGYVPADEVLGELDAEHAGRRAV